MHCSINYKIQLGHVLQISFVSKINNYTFELKSIHQK